jgi:transmembrane sensor
MMQRAPADPPSDAIEQAATWAARRTDPRPLAAEEQARFDRWLAADPANRRRLATLERTWRDPHLVAAGRGAGTAGSWRRRVLLGGAASVAGAAWVGRAPIERQVADHATAIGEIAAVQPVHGARVLLDTASAIAGGGNTWRLLQGAARVDLDPGVAFVLAGRGGAVAANGAGFVLRRGVEADRVAVLAGHVTVAGTPVPPGHGATLHGMAPPAPTPLALAERDAAEGFAEAWRIFTAAPLADVLAELARYRAAPVWTAAAAARIRVSGRFRFIAPEAVLAALAATLPIRLQRLGPLVRIVPA